MIKEVYLIENDIIMYLARIGYILLSNCNGCMRITIYKTICIIIRMSFTFFAWVCFPFLIDALEGPTKMSLEGNFRGKFIALQ